MSPFEPTDDDSTAASAACRQCGTCCRKGGPALHKEDRHLVMDGLIPAEALYTIRAGEPVQDNVAGRRSYADTDIIKIKGKGDGWCCRFLDDESSRCTIYDRRPAELSGGQQQRLCIARAIAVNPEVAAVERILSLMPVPGAVDVLPFFDGRLLVAVDVGRRAREIEIGYARMLCARFSRRGYDVWTLLPPLHTRRLPEGTKTFNVFAHDML